MEEMLKDIRILDFTTNVAGPTCTAMFADYGAEVIKIERPVLGDDNRGFAPALENNESLPSSWSNRGKKSIVIDLTDPKGVEIVKRMIPDVDVIVESFKPGVMKKFGLDYDEVVKIKPDIVYGSISAFGQKGPYSKEPGYDIIAQAMSGLMHMTGYPDGEPIKSGTTIGDYVGAMNGYASILTAIYYQRRTGIGQHVDVALVQGLLWMNGGIDRTNVGMFSNRSGNHMAVLAPYGLFNGSNGQSVIIGAVNPKLWTALCNCMGHPELANDERYNTVTKRCANLKDVIGYIETWLKSYDDINVPAKMLKEAGIPSCKVYDLHDVIADPHFKEANWLCEAELPDDVSSRRTFLTRNVNATFSKTPGKIKKAPALGQHNYEILTKYGLSKEDIDKIESDWAAKVKK